MAETTKLICLGGPYTAGIVVEKAKLPEGPVSMLPLQLIFLTFTGAMRGAAVSKGSFETSTCHASTTAFGIELQLSPETAVTVPYTFRGITTIGVKYGGIPWSRPRKGGVKKGEDSGGVQMVGSSNVVFA